jgi:signal transduction histidine kinase
MSGRTAAGRSSDSAERPAATLPLPNGLAYAIAAFEVLAVVVLPFAVIAGGESLSGAWTKMDLHNLALPAILGALILWRRPGHVIGWVLVAAAGLDSLVISSVGYRYYRPDGFAGLPSGDATWDALNFCWVLAATCLLVLLPQLFPDGRVLSRRWRPLLWFGVSAPVPLAILFILEPRIGNLDSSYAWAFPLFALAVVASLVPLVVRFRRAGSVVRQQLKWVFFGVAISLPVCALGFALIGGSPGETSEALTPTLTLVPLVIIPVTMTVAVLRFRLYDIDVVISRTLLVAGLVGFITAAYVAIVVGVGSLLGGGGGEPNIVLSVLATTVVAVAFQPVRRWLQRVANRLVFGRRSTPYDVLSGFATRVGAGESSPQSLVHLAELLAGGTGASPARVWLRVGLQLRVEATWPADAGAAGELESIDIDADGVFTELPGADLAVPVTEHGELLGVLTIAKPRGERVSEVDVDLVERLAAASGVVLRNLRLDAELTQRLEDLEASRRRLVTAQDDARRRIEADLAGGSRAELDLLRDRLTHLAADVDPQAAPKTTALLGQLVEATDGALETLAGLAAGVYPPRLAADGLVVALTEQAGKAALPVQVEPAGVGRYGPEVEAAVYFAVLEALQNTAKYANADMARVRLTHEAGRLSFEVTDDGAGFDTTTTTLGTGLQGITDRLDTVGGTVTITSVPGTGTTITGHIPVPSTPAVEDAQPSPQFAGATP